MKIKIEDIEIPGIQTNTPFLLSTYNATEGYSNIGNNSVSLTEHFLMFLAQQIIDQETRDLDIDGGKLQQMIDSQDIEMNELAYSMLRDKCKYTVDILIYIKTNQIYSLERIILDFIRQNSTNITGKIR